MDHCGGRIEYDGNNDVFTAEKQLAEWAPPEPWSECEALIAVMEFVFGLGDKGGFWNVLSFWRARLY